MSDPILPSGDARTVRPGESVTYHRPVEREVDGKVPRGVTAGQQKLANAIERTFRRVGAPIAGVDFEKLAHVQNDDSRLVDGWEPPHGLPTEWREVARGDDGAKWINARRRLAAILSCSVESDGRAWLHLSVSHQSKRTPTHGELRICKELFLGDRYGYAVYPPRKMYVNICEVLHVFALLDEDAAPPLPEFSGGTGSI